MLKNLSCADPILTYPPILSIEDRRQSTIKMYQQINNLSAEVLIQGIRHIYNTMNS